MENSYTWAYQLVNMDRISDYEIGDFNNYEEALEKGLQEALKLIPQSDED